MLVRWLTFRADYKDNCCYLNGKLFVSLAMTSQIAVLNSDGTEEARINSASDGNIPLDNPAGIAFDSASKALLIANHDHRQSIRHFRLTH